MSHHVLNRMMTSHKMHAYFVNAGTAAVVVVVVNTENDVVAWVSFQRS